MPGRAASNPGFVREGERGALPEFGSTTDYIHWTPDLNMTQDWHVLRGHNRQHSAPSTPRRTRIRQRPKDYAFCAAELLQRWQEVTCCFSGILISVLQDIFSIKQKRCWESVWQHWEHRGSDDLRLAAWAAEQSARAQVVMLEGLSRTDCCQAGHQVPGRPAASKDHQLVDGERFSGLTLWKPLRKKRDTQLGRQLWPASNEL